MTREIKFRVWDSYDKKFLNYGEVDIWDLIFEEPKLIEEIYTDGMANECLEFLQYTGLKDNNGKEIYEGDIVLGRFILDDVEDYIYLYLTDMERKNQSKTFLIEDISYLYTNPIPEDIEVIGNIYENKDVLKELNI